MSNPKRNALVTGGTKGIGRAVALRLAQGGAAVTCVYRSDDAAAEGFTRDAAALGTPVRVEKADVSRPDEVLRLFDGLARSEREPDWLVNAAGITRDAPLVFTSPDDFDAVVRGNLTATFLVCQQAVKAMVRRRFGRIVNFASPAALLGNEGQSAYAAAKAGILGLTRTLAREVARYGITANVLSPGLVATELAGKLGPEQARRIVERTPLRRMGTPEEMAAAVAFLVDELAGYMTGACLSVDGGLT